MNGDPLTAASATAADHLMSDWIQRLANIALNIATTAWTFTLGIVFTLRATFNDGVLVNAPATTNRDGAVATGNGSGYGLRGTGGATGGGLIGVGGSSSGDGVVGSGTAGGGAGGNFSAANGYGVTVAGNATKAAVHFTPQAFTAGTGPSSPTEGDEFYNGTDHKKYLYNGSAWVVVGSQS